MRNIFNRLRNIYGGQIKKSFDCAFATESIASPINKTKATDKPTLILSASCIKQLKEISERENKKYLRITVDGGGCSGFQYKFDLVDKINEDDIVIGDNNSQVVIDTTSLEYCAGSTLDYHTELIRSGFRIMDNPKAEQGCSCGASFSIKID